MKKKLLFNFLIVFIFCFSFVLGQYFNFNKDVVVNESDIGSSNGNVNFISMMLEQNYGKKDYEKSTLSEFPRDGYIFNDSLSGCENGGILSWNEEKKKVVLKGNISDKCYAYFDKYNLPVIKNVLVSNITSTSLTINVTSEKGTNDIASYYYSISSNSNDTNFVNDVSNSYSFSNLISNTTYYIKVYAVDSNGKSSDIYSLSQKTKVVYTWSKYDIKETTNYKVQTNSGSGRIYLHYEDGDTWERYRPVIYSSYSIGSNGKFYCSGRITDVSVPLQYYTGETDKNGNKEYRALTDEEINSYFKDYIGKYVCSDEVVSNLYDSDSLVVITSNMTSSGNSRKGWLVTDTLSAVANGTTKSKGTYIEDVTSDNSSAYPSNGISGSYWYVRK